MSRSRQRALSRPTRIVFAVLLVLGLGLPLAVGAQVAPGTGSSANVGGPAWNALSPAQQAALAPLKRDWQNIDAPRKQKWLEIAARFPSMPPEEQQRVQERMREWARMSPDERGRARLQFQEARQISPQDRQARWDAYLALPADERRALATSASAVPQAGSGASRQRPAAASAVTDRKLNVVSVPTAQVAPKSIAPVVVQAKPGASTTLVSKTATPPAHAQVGQPKIVATPDAVNRSTLLPQTGPQSATGVAAPVPAAAPASGLR